MAAGALKLPYIDASVAAVRAYQLLPIELTQIVGIALPIIEVAIGLLLMTGTFTRISAAIGSLLMLAFVIGIASVWVRGISIDCGCFGGGGPVEASRTAYPWEIARDLGLMLLGTWTVWRPSAPFAIDAWLMGEGAVGEFPEAEYEEVR